jgi:transposase
MDNTTFTKELLQSLSKDELIEIILLQSAQINALMKEVAELKERLNQNSNNSSRPPSSDGYKKPNPKSLRKSSGKKRGGQFGHKGHGLKLPYEIKEKVKLSPEICSFCGGDLHDVEGEKTETRYEHDIPQVKITTTVYEVFEKTCPYCGEVVSGTFPESVKSTQQYGANIKAFIVLLNQYGMTAINKIKTILESLFGAKISESTIVSTIKNCADRLKSSQEEIKAAVSKEKVVHFDETGMRNNGVLL